MLIWSRHNRPGPAVAQSPHNNPPRPRLSPLLPTPRPGPARSPGRPSRPSRALRRRRYHSAPQGGSGRWRGRGRGEGGGAGKPRSPPAPPSLLSCWGARRKGEAAGPASLPRGRCGARAVDARQGAGLFALSGRKERGQPAEASATRPSRSSWGRGSPSLRPRARLARRADQWAGPGRLVAVLLRSRASPAVPGWRCARAWPPCSRAVCSWATLGFRGPARRKSRLGRERSRRHSFCFWISELGSDSRETEGDKMRLRAEQCSSVFAKASSTPPNTFHFFFFLSFCYFNKSKCRKWGNEMRTSPCRVVPSRCF